ncbi:mycofactocin system transcriptional regulator [Yinghuangia sp. YIM S10712]|uniref:mycofactocin system transcriptional regulator n=1 Tax=Yinghuangia sp. YIM S10712 TaxID=3436930 RepID=UPI003F52D3D0
MEATGTARGRSKQGRPPATSRASLERLGFELFARNGFDDTTIDDIAAAAGIARRTFFRYFASKNDLVWGDFEEHLGRLRELLAASAADAPVMDVLREAIMEFNRFDVADVPWHRQRMRLILRVPTLQGDATVRYATWRGIITDFAAERTGLPPDALVPRLIGHASLAAALSAYESWLDDDEADLPEFLDQALRHIATGLDAVTGATESLRQVPR